MAIRASDLAVSFPSAHTQRHGAIDKSILFVQFGLGSLLAMGCWTRITGWPKPRLMEWLPRMAETISRSRQVLNFFGITATKVQDQRLFESIQGLQLVLSLDNDKCDYLLRGERLVALVKAAPLTAAQRAVVDQTFQQDRTLGVVVHQLIRVLWEAGQDRDFIAGLGTEIIPAAIRDRALTFGDIAHRSRALLALETDPEIVALMPKEKREAGFMARRYEYYLKVAERMGLDPQASTDIESLVILLDQKGKLKAFLSQLQLTVRCVASYFSHDSHKCARALSLCDADELLPATETTRHALYIPEPIRKRVFSRYESDQRQIATVQDFFSAASIPNEEANAHLLDLIGRNNFNEKHAAGFEVATKVLLTVGVKADSPASRQVRAFVSQIFSVENNAASRPLLVGLLRILRPLSGYRNLFTAFSPLKNRGLLVYGDPDKAEANFWFMSHVLLYTDAEFAERIESYQAAEVEVGGQTYFPARLESSALEIAPVVAFKELTAKTQVLVGQFGATQEILDRFPELMHLGTPQLSKTNAIGRAFYRTAMALIESGEYQKAIQHFNRAEALLQKEKNPAFGVDAVTRNRRLARTLLEISEELKKEVLPWEALKQKLQQAYRLCCYVSDIGRVTNELEFTAKIAAQIKKRLSQVMIGQLSDQESPGQIVAYRRALTYQALSSPRYRAQSAIAADAAISALVEYRRKALTLKVYDAMLPYFSEHADLFEVGIIALFEPSISLCISQKNWAILAEVGNVILSDLAARGVIVGELMGADANRNAFYLAANLLVYEAANAPIIRKSFRTSFVSNATELARFDLSRGAKANLEAHQRYLESHLAGRQVDYGKNPYGALPYPAEKAQILWTVVGEQVKAEAARINVSSGLRGAPSVAEQRLVATLESHQFLRAKTILDAKSIHPTLGFNAARLLRGIEALAYRTMGVKSYRLAIDILDLEGYLSWRVIDAHPAVSQRLEGGRAMYHLFAVSALAWRTSKPEETHEERFERLTRAQAGFYRVIRSSFVTADQRAALMSQWALLDTSRHLTYRQIKEWSCLENDLLEALTNDQEEI